MPTPTFKNLNLFLLKEKRWEKKPKAKGKALYGVAVRLKDIKDNVAIRYKTVEIDNNGEMFVLHYPNFNRESKAKDLRSKSIEPSKDIQTIDINDNDPLSEDFVYIDNSYDSLCPGCDKLSQKWSLRSEPL